MALFVWFVILFSFSVWGLKNVLGREDMRGRYEFENTSSSGGVMFDTYEDSKKYRRSQLKDIFLFGLYGVVAIAASIVFGFLTSSYYLPILCAIVIFFLANKLKNNKKIPLQ